MDLDELKSKYLNKAAVDIKDVHLAMKAVPFLLREVVKLENALEKAEKRIAFLTPDEAQRPPLKRKGDRPGGKWEVEVNEKENVLLFILAGKLDYATAKQATGHIMAVSGHLMADMDVVADLSGVETRFDRKFLFHLRKVFYNLKLIGIGRVVRIVNPKAPGLMKLFEEQALECPFRLYTARTVHEAEQILEHAGKFLKI